MKLATIRQCVRGIAAQDGAGVKLSRIIGQPLLQNLDPFLMLDEFGSADANDYLPGFPPHPHRGFQTVTYMLQGKMRHRDSVGNDGVIESGGIQWMNAGKGIIHEEMPEQESGVLRGFQLWVNLPADEKMSAPDYQDIRPSAVPSVHLTHDVQMKLLSGTYADRVGPVTNPNSQRAVPFFADLTARDRTQLRMSLQPEYQYFLYVYEGAVSIANKTVSKGVLATLDQADTIDLMVEQPDTQWILVGGQPIGEPIVQYGPFVMNTQQEIEQAVTDYQHGRLTA